MNLLCIVLSCRSVFSVLKSVMEIVPVLWIETETPEEYSFRVPPPPSNR